MQEKRKFIITCKFLTPLLDVVLKHPIEINKMTAMIAVTIKFRGWSGIKSSVHSSIAPHKPLKKDVRFVQNIFKDNEETISIAINWLDLLSIDRNLPPNTNAS